VSKPKKGAAAPKKSSRMGLVAGIAVLAVAALIAVSVLNSPKSKESKQPDAALTAEGNTKGQATAKVKVVEYGDYL